ncbi:MAG: phosphomannomutase/phosphoglucomutase [Planctomycetota bacterium]|jgi:phosphomannomutase
MGIFKAYDIRGIFPEEIDAAKAEAIGRAFAAFIGAGPIVVGRDMRESGPVLRDALVSGLVAAGATVWDVGMISTPMLYFAVGHLGAAGGVTVTASHNPAKYNGFKMCKAEAYPLSGTSGLPEVQRLTETGVPDAEKPGNVEERDIRVAYERHVASFARETRPLRIVVDASNGMAGVTIPGVSAVLASTLIPLYFEPDGTFPHHEANPLKAENLRDVIEVVRREKADFGACLDGDGDRCVFVDEQGSILPGDIVTALIANQILEETGPAAVVYDLRSSHVVPETIEKLGGTPVRERVGHSFIKVTMREHDSPFAGELSGHYYFRDNYYADCGEIALIKMLNLVSGSDQPLSQRVKPLQRYALSGEVNFRVEDKDAKIRELAEVFGDAKIDYLDGITAEYEGWWFNVRKSNTEPMLRLNLEGKTEAAKAEGMKRVLAVLGEPLN